MPLDMANSLSPRAMFTVSLPICYFADGSILPIWSVTRLNAYVDTSDQLGILRCRDDAEFASCVGIKKHPHVLP